MNFQNSEKSVCKKTLISESYTKIVKTQTRTITIESKEKPINSKLVGSTVWKPMLTTTTFTKTSSTLANSNFKSSYSFPTSSNSKVTTAIKTPTTSTLSLPPSWLPSQKIRSASVSKTTNKDAISKYKKQNNNPFVQEFGAMSITPSRTLEPLSPSLPKIKDSSYVSPYTGNVIKKVQSTRPLETSFFHPSQLLSQKPSIIVSPPPALPKVNVIKDHKSLNPGVCYIFNHEKFDSPRNPQREGSQEDVDHLQTTFELFKVNVMKIFKNYTVENVRKEVEKITKKDFSKNSCIIIVILSHGDRFEQIAAKNGVYSVDDDILFPILRNKTLDSKPKFFIIQACKGDIDPRKYSIDSGQSAIPHGKPVEILKCYSTFEGFVSYRTTKGSIFIQTFCELFKSHGRNKDIREIMDLVRDRVKTETGEMQIPSVYTTLTKPYIFGDYL